MGGPMLTICLSYDVLLRRELAFVGRDDCTCAKFLVTLIFKIAINSLTIRQGYYSDVINTAACGVADWL